MKGGEFSTRLFDFCEICNFRASIHGNDDGSKVRQCVFLGFDKLNGWYLVCEDSKVRTVRVVSRLQPSMKYNLQAVEGVKALP